MKKVIAWIAKHEFLVGVMILAAVLRIPSLFEPNWYGDEGVYLVMGQALKHGLVWYRDIHDNKPPLLYLLAAISGNVMYFRAVLLVWMMATLVVFDRLAKSLNLKVRSRRMALVIFAVLTSLPAIEGNIANAEIFMILPTILGVWILIESQGLRIKKEKTSGWSYLGAGACFGLAFLFKVPAVFEFSGMVFFYWVLAKKNIKEIFKGVFEKEVWLLILGFVIPVALTVLYYLSVGALKEYFMAAFAQNLGYLASYRTGHIGSGVGNQSGLLQRGLILLLVVGIFWLFNRKKERGFSLVWIWFMFSLFAVLLSERPYPHYLIQLIACGSLLLGMINFERFREWFWVSLAILLLLVSIYRFKFYFYPTITYYNNFVNFILGKESVEKYNDYFDGKVNRTAELSTYLRKITDVNEKIFVWADEPFIYVESARLPVGKYMVAYHIVDFGGMDETIQKLTTEAPRVIVVSDRESADFPQLKILLATNYILVNRFDDAKVYFKLVSK